MLFRSYSSDSFGKCLYGNSSEYGQIFSLPVANLENNTLEFSVYMPDSGDVIISSSDSSVCASTYDCSFSGFKNGATIASRIFLKIALSSGFHSVSFQFDSFVDSNICTGNPFSVYVDGGLLDSKALYYYILSGNKVYPCSVSFFPLSNISFWHSYFHLGFYNDTQFLDEVDRKSVV